MRFHSRLCMLLIIVASVTAFAFAAEDGKPATTTIAAVTTAAPAVAEVAPAAKPVAKPSVPARKFGLTYGFDERFRSENWNNYNDQSGAKDDETRQLRFRTRVFATFTAGDSFEAGFRITNEATKKISDSAPPYFGTASPYHANEIFFDNAYVNFKRLPGIPSLSLKVGRFDIIKGDGFAIFEGGTGDGSRSIYFNAFDLAYSHKKYKVELIGIYDPKYDEFFPVVNGQSCGATPAACAAVHGNTGKQMTEWDESAMGVYFTDRNHKNTDVDAYYLFKKEYNDLRALTNYLYQPDRHFSTIGARLVERFPQVPGLKLTAEFADEIGTQDSMSAALPSTPIRAWGGYAYARKDFAAKVKPWITVGMWAFSGGDKNGRTDGNFDPLFGRWAYCPQLADMPCYSEGMVYSTIPENGVAYFSNLKMFQAEAGFSPIKKLRLSATYARLTAFHPFSMNAYHLYTNPITQPASATALFSDNGTNRGQLLKTRLEWFVNKSNKAYLYLEKDYFGDFYKANSNAYFVRAEWMYTFKENTQFGGIKK